jgi:hypothetical protein
LACGSRIELLNQEQLQEFIKDGSSNSFIGTDYSFSLTNLGNNSIGWILLFSQPTAGYQAERFIMPQRRKELGLSMGSFHTGGHVGDVSGGEAMDWKVPDDQPQTQSIHPVVPMIAFDQLSTENLNGTESRDLGLFLVQEMSVPFQCTSIIAQSDPRFTSAMDNQELYGDYFPKSYSSPKFHPGRVLLLGDAGHTLATSVIGNHGMTLALLDVVCVVELIGKLGGGKSKDADFSF